MKNENENAKYCLKSIDPFLKLYFSKIISSNYSKRTTYTDIFKKRRQNCFSTKFNPICIGYQHKLKQMATYYRGLKYNAFVNCNINGI